MVGDAEDTSMAGLQYPDGGVAFLLREQFQQNGVVYAFRACYRNLNPVRFQIWRPQSAGSTAYRLVTEVVHRYTSVAESLPALETVSITDKRNEKHRYKTS